MHLTDLPSEAQALVLHKLDLASLLAVSQTSRAMHSLCLQRVFPVRAADAAGVRRVRCSPELGVGAWARVVDNLLRHPSARTLHVCVQLTRADSVQGLALQYAVTMQDIFRANALLSENHVASRSHLYIPLATEGSVVHYTGAPTAASAPLLVRDSVLVKKHFLVALFKNQDSRSYPGPNAAQKRRESYVSQLLVRLIAKGLSVDDSEVRFYLADNDNDVAKAYHALLSDRQWTP